MLEQQRAKMYLYPVALRSGTKGPCPNPKKTSTAPESSCSVLYIPPADAWHCMVT